MPRDRASLQALLDLWPRTRQPGWVVALALRAPVSPSRIRAALAELLATSLGEGPEVAEFLVHCLEAARGKPRALPFAADGATELTDRVPAAKADLIRLFDLLTDAFALDLSDPAPPNPDWADALRARLPEVPDLVRSLQDDPPLGRPMTASLRLACERAARPLAGKRRGRLAMAHAMSRGGGAASMLVEVMAERLAAGSWEVGRADGFPDRAGVAGGRAGGFPDRVGVAGGRADGFPDRVGVAGGCADGCPTQASLTLTREEQVARLFLADLAGPGLVDGGPAAPFPALGDVLGWAARSAAGADTTAMWLVLGWDAETRGMPSALLDLEDRIVEARWVVARKVPLASGAQPWLPARRPPRVPRVSAALWALEPWGWVPAR